ncbi:hypothetical protein OG946_21725 [Streptomyces sp. NBC_01808]|uniref:hypothetical protein n=1 Tax=Streptomyces sp. NBC_01808 TaxID=2975947 RepID=UPI002DD8D33A|nr:hypothetical protein [Streptomyces sp. NBC_01808]WSA39757.1 hypothetical protein OG946_21725 [Streptomyces sp. NBC_01808]
MATKGKRKKPKPQPTPIRLEVLVEEESAGVALRHLLAKILEGHNVRVGIRQFRGSRIS